MFCSSRGNWFAGKAVPGGGSQVGSLRSQAGLGFASQVGSLRSQ